MCMHYSAVYIVSQNQYLVSQNDPYVALDPRSHDTFSDTVLPKIPFL